MGARQATVAGLDVGTAREIVGRCMAGPWPSARRGGGRRCHDLGPGRGQARKTSPSDWVRIHPTAQAIRNYALVRREWASAVAIAAADPAIETALTLLAKVRAGLVRLRQGDSRC